MHIDATSTTVITAEFIAQRFGLNTQHGVYAWRVILNSPLDSARCRTLVSLRDREVVEIDFPHIQVDAIVQPETMTHQHNSVSSTEPPFKLVNDAESLLLRGAPHPAIEEFFSQHGSALVLACISQLGEVRHLAWSSQALPLFILFKECSFSPLFEQFVRSSPQGPKLYTAFVRGTLRLIQQGDWVETLGTEDEVDKYTFFGAGQVDVVASLLVALPTLINIVSALADSPPPRRHEKGAELVRVQLRNNMDKLAMVAPELLWLPDGDSTELSGKLAYIYNALHSVKETLRM